MSTKLKDKESIEQIIQEMSLEEKAMLVTGGSPFYSQPMETYGIPEVLMLDGGTGFNSMQYGLELNYRKAAEELEAAGTPVDREKLGGMGGFLVRASGVQESDNGNITENEETEAEHGCYPPGMFLGATWNPLPIEACGKALGKEMTAKGVDIILGTPNVNIHRDPLNGRLFEGYSEDPCLTAKLAPAFVKGVQSVGAVANVKHFAANNQETDRMGVDEHIPERALREIYLPGFKACVDAGCKTVMSAYNKINGVPCAMNSWLLTDILRKEWGFNGFVVSDWSAAYDQVGALQAGNDLAMPGPRGIKTIMEAVENGVLSEEKLDQSIRNILNVFLETPVLSGRKTTFDMQETIAATEYAAREGITLLKNDGILPLSRETKVVFYGKRSKAFAGSGAGSAEVETSLLTNPFDSTAAMIGSEKVSFEKAEADTKVWIVTVGANGQEGVDRADMDMDAEDAEALRKAIKEAGEAKGKVILVLNTEGPVSLEDYENQVSAIICTYYPGMQGGKVLADILFGETNPSGKLPFTYPKYYRDCPSYKNFPGENQEVWYGEGIYVGYRYFEAKGIMPLYPFGYGLSYTAFSITDMQVKEKVDVDDGEVQVFVKIKNTGKMAGAEVVQLYVHDVISKIDKPEKELKGFQKVFLEPGEEKQICIVLKKEDFSSYSMELGAWVCEPGEFDIMVGNSSANIQQKSTVIIKCKNPFGLKAVSKIGDVAANAQAVQIINKILHENFLTMAGTAIIFTPGMKFEEIWKHVIAPAYEKKGIVKEQTDEMYMQILAGFAEL